MSFLNIPSQFTILFLCLIQSLLRRLKKPTQQMSNQAKISKQEQSTSPPTANVQLQQLLSRKKQIEDTVQELNNPSTFAKYSKMKRELIKVQAKIKEMTAAQSQNIKVGQQTSPKFEEKKEKEEQKKQESLLPSWFFVLFNIFIICLSYTLRTSVLPHWSTLPISWFVDQEGRANCILVYFSCKMILN